MEPTREVFGNISPGMQSLFYAVIFVSLAVMVRRVLRRVRLWRRGVNGEVERDWRVWVRRIAEYAVAQKRVRRKSLGGLLHAFLFCGFVVLTIGTTLLFIADRGPVNFHHGLYYLFYELTMDVFGVALCVGCVLALYRRIAARPASLGHNSGDWRLLSLLLAIGVTGFLVEALRISYTNPDPAIARWSSVGYLISFPLNSVLTLRDARILHMAMWWLHVALIVTFFARIPLTRFLHVITGTLNIALRPSRHAGALASIAMEDVEKTGRIGVSAVEHFAQQQLLSFDACMECGRCQDVCPAYATDKPLSPKLLITDLRQLMEADPGRKLHGETILAETLWACTMCQACVYECPVLIGHVDVISDLRRNLVGEGQLAGPPAQALRRLGNQSNPYGQAQQDRLAWADGLNVPTAKTNPDFEVLLWIGCAAAYDPRAQKVARATVKVLQEANVNFAVLGNEEKCTGDPARRLGDEFLFQQLAQDNIATLTRCHVRKIVTPCPHCFNTLKNEYPQFDGNFEVQHHSQFLTELIAAGTLSRNAQQASRVTLHDPCYLARVNGETAAQRTILGALVPEEQFVEMPRHGVKTFCCGAGGGRMWFEEAPAQRVSSLRAQEAIATGASVVATACPFCLNMMSDGVAGAAGGEAVRVMDIAELLAEDQT